MKSLLDYTDREPMDETQSRAFMMATMAEMGGDECPEDIKDLFGYKVMRKRLEIGDIPVSDWVVFFLSSLCDNPAKLVMYAHVCVELYRKYKEEIKIDHIAQAFPMGFPSDKDLKDCWDSQKIPLKERNSPSLDNYLDTSEPWLVEVDV